MIECVVCAKNLPKTDFYEGHSSCKKCYMWKHEVRKTGKKFCGSCKEVLDEDEFLVSGKNGNRSHHCEKCQGLVRGLLCAGCNFSVGILENREWTDRAYAYLKATDSTWAETPV